LSALTISSHNEIGACGDVRMSVNNRVVNLWASSRRPGLAGRPLPSQLRPGDAPDQKPAKVSQSDRAPRRSGTVSTCMKSAARMPPACAARNCRELSRQRTSR
jgi:hypothetical protein